MLVRIEDAEQLELSHELLIGRQSGAATLENSLPVSYKAKHILTMQPHTPTPMHLFLKNENVCSHKNKAL